MPLHCPHCSRPIPDDEALLCLYCGESLNRSCGCLAILKTHPWKCLTVLLLILLIAILILR